MEDPSFLDWLIIVVSAIVDILMTVFEVVPYE